MDTFSIPLTDLQREHLNKRVASGDFPDAGSYLQALIATDRQRTTALMEAIQQGLDSGLSPYSLDEIIADAKKHYLENQGS